MSQTGSGAAVVTTPGYALITASNSAKPGDTLVIWGTGLGPISGSDAVVPAGGDLGTPLTVYVGGVSANVTYRGRSGAPGLDQINFVVPQGVTGCYVSLVIQTGSTVSNTTSLAIANNGGVCSDPFNVPVSQLSPGANGGLRVGEVILSDVNVSTSLLGQTYNQDIRSGTAEFLQYSAAQLTTNAGAFARPSVGSCTAAVTFIQTSTTSPAPPTPIGPTTLDAGPSLTVVPPSGANTSLASASKGVYSATIAALPPGVYSVSNGSGGVDVGAFTAHVNVPAALQWTNQSTVSATPVDRTQPLKLTWTGGDPASVAYIEGTSGSSPSASGATFVGSFSCIVPVSAGQFTVPPSVLLSMPPTATIAGSYANGLIVMGTSTAPQLFTATGLDLGYAMYSGRTSASVSFK